MSQGETEMFNSYIFEGLILYSPLNVMQSLMDVQMEWKMFELEKGLLICICFNILHEQNIPKN